MKTLKAIQTLSRIGQILCKIVFVFCIVGFCFCLAGILGLALGGEVFRLGGVTVHSLITDHTGYPLSYMYAAMAAGMLACAAEAVLCRFAERYFRNELADGTPFTLRGAKELLRLGILTAAIYLGVSIACSIGFSVVGHADARLGKFHFGDYSPIGLGIAMIIASLLCRYGAETGGQGTGS